MISLETIGQCRACLRRPRVLDAGIRVCIDCTRRHTRRWLALCIRAREDERFRASVRAHLGPSAKRIFDKMFGPIIREVR